jgi:hypothetical protein
MFKPTISCKIFREVATNLYGEPTLKKSFPAKCAIVKLLLRTQKTSVRADSSGSRGAAQETIADAVLLFAPMTSVEMDDVIQVAGAQLRVTGRFPRYDLNGDFDHWQIEGRIFN